MLPQCRNIFLAGQYIRGECDEITKESRTLRVKLQSHRNTRTILPSVLINTLADKVCFATDFTNRGYICYPSLEINYFEGQCG